MYLELLPGKYNNTVLRPVITAKVNSFEYFNKYILNLSKEIILLVYFDDDPVLVMFLVVVVVFLVLTVSCLMRSRQKLLLNHYQARSDR